MNPSELIIWAIFLGIAWLVFSSITGIDEWFRSRIGLSKTKELEERLKNLEARLELLEKQKEN